MVVPPTTESNAPSGSIVQINMNNTGGLPGGEMQSTLNNIGKDSSPPKTELEDRVMLALPAPSDGLYSQPSTSVGPPKDENDHPYVGLVNQAMTCYLNSLVQSLYMTPEFRNAMYKWEYRGDKMTSVGGASIPCQIQKLFLLLQTTDQEALETKDLTASFGWAGNEAYDQHDVQELCRLMFDALELKWKGTQHEKLIECLYRGTMQDFVKCLKCGKENVRPDVFLDLPLAVKPFGATEAFKSIEDALHAFVTPELLEGSNQYHCEGCASKQNAHKGLRVTSFPYLLTIQLKRFDFDYNTMHRIKLNDRVTFPDVLNLNPFVHKAERSNNHEEKGKETMETMPVVVGEAVNEDVVKNLLKEGEFVYELFSVMVHQGSAAGGHYFAYIKNMEQDKWYCFNDTRVDVATSLEISRSFGSTGGWSGSNTNAYMLMYRQMNKDRNQPFIRTVDLPSHITNLKQRWREMEEARAKDAELKEKVINVTFRLNMPCDSEILMNGVFTIDISRDKTITEAFYQAFAYLTAKAKAFDETIVRKAARLLLFRNNKIERVYQTAHDLDKPLSTCLFTPGQRDVSFLFDVSKATRVQYERKDLGLNPTIRVSRVDVAARAVRPEIYVSLREDHAKVIKAKEVIGSLFGDGPRESIVARLVIDKKDSSNPRDYRPEDICLLDGNGVDLFQILKNCISTVPLLYYDGGVRADDLKLTSTDRGRNPLDSVMFSILDRKKFAHRLRVQLPTEEELRRAHSTCTVMSCTETMSSATVVSDPVSIQHEMIPEGEAMSCSPPCGDWNGAGPDSVGSNDRPPSDDINSDHEMQVSSSDSFCNNTPQVSPNVSDTDESAGGTKDYQAYIFGVNGDILPMPRGACGDAASTVSTLVPPSTNGDYSQKVVVLSRVDNLLRVDVDLRLTASEMKRWIAQQMGIPDSQFVIMKHHSEEHDNGYEYTVRDEDTVGTAFGSVCKLSVTLRPPLKDDEKMIKIIHFDLEEFNKDNWRVLFELPASQRTLTGDLLRACQRLYFEHYATQIGIEQIRLRDMNQHSMSGSRCPVLSPSQPLSTREHSWSNNIYMQIVTDERVRGKKGTPLLIRRFFSSKVEVSGIHEALVKWETPAGEQNGELRRAISAVSGLSEENVLFTEPPVSAWKEQKWPCLRSRLEMLDGVVSFVREAQSAQEKPLFSCIGSKVIYYKDSTESNKQLTDDERRQIKIKDNVSSPGTAVQRRKERPLRIQMSSISEP